MARPNSVNYFKKSTSMQNSKIYLLGTKEFQAYCVARTVAQMGGLENMLNVISESQAQKQITRFDAKRKRDYLKKAFAMFGNATESMTPTTKANEIKPSVSVLKSARPRGLQIDFSEFKTAKEFYKYCTYQYMKQVGGLDVLLQRVEDAKTVGKMPQDRAIRFKAVLTAISTKFAFKELFASVCQEVKRKQKVQRQSKA